jgi:signal peptidase
MKFKPFKIIYNFFVICLVIIALLLIISVLPITGNFKVLTVLSGSMEPAIHTGSIVVVKPATEYKIGDVITFGKISKIEIPTTHRIFDIKLQEGKPVYITKGDANNSPDMKEVLGSEVAGKVLFSVPYAGFAVDFAKKPFGFMIVIIVPALLIMYDEFKKIFVEIKKMRNKKKNTDETRISADNSDDRINKE